MSVPLYAPILGNVFWLQIYYFLWDYNQFDRMSFLFYGAAAGVI